MFENIHILICIMLQGQAADVLLQDNSCSQQEILLQVCVVEQYLELSDQAATD